MTVLGNELRVRVSRRLGIPSYEVTYEKVGFPGSWTIRMSARGVTLSRRGKTEVQAGISAAARLLRYTKKGYRARVRARRHRELSSS